MRPLLPALLLLLAGCTAQPHADEAPLAAATQPDDAHANMTAAEHGNVTAPANATRAFPAQEHDLHAGLYARVPAANASTGNMREASWTVDIPLGARTIRVVANVTSPASVVAGALVLMVHNGTAEQPGGMLAGSNGSADRVGPVAIPDGARTLCVMFHAEGDPAAAQGPLDAHLVATFA